MTTQTTTQNATLTFFTLDDLLDDLRYRCFRSVRCEATVQSIGGGQTGPLRRYVVTLTAHDEQTNEVLVCTLVIGECWAVFASHEPHHAENLDKAKNIVFAYLLEFRVHLIRI